MRKHAREKEIEKGMKKEERKIFAAVIAEYGEDEQMRIAQEECAELIQAISKYHRAQMSGDSRHRKKDLERAEKSLIEEIADVSIMIDQLKMIIHGNHNDVRTAKVERIGARLERAADAKARKPRAKNPDPAEEAETE